MFAHLTKKQTKNLVSVATILILAGALAAPMAFAKARTATKTADRAAGMADQGPNHIIFRAGTNGVSRIDPIATVTARGRQIILTGPVFCDNGDQVSLRVTVTQRSTGAVAEGQAFFTSNGNEQHWTIVAIAQGREAFAEGPAVGVALGRTSTRGQATDAHQWLVDLTLVAQ